MRLSSPGRLWLLVFFSFLLAGCSGAYNPGNLRVQTDFVPSGSLRLAQISGFFSRADVMGESEARTVLISCGVREQDIGDRSVALARIYCCGGPNEIDSARMIYVPPTITANAGDIVEIRVGSIRAGNDPGTLNTVTRVCQANGADGPIRWDPPNDRLWVRVLYADWMPAQGWVHQGGLSPAWYKPPSK